MKAVSPGVSSSARRQFLLTLGAIFTEACRTMSQVRGADILLADPHPDVWHPVLRAMIVTVLPFEHPAFPPVSADEILEEIQRLFRLTEDEGFAFLPKALMLFDDAPLFETPLAPFVEDERRDLALSQVPEDEIPGALERAIARDRDAWRTYASKFGQARFGDQSLAARRGYLSLWSGSSFVTRRRFYRGAKALVTITAYSLKPFWDAVGYEGPLLQRG